ncbi:MAG TPA: glycosyltransferase [Chitinophagaceae bacterium]|jgi:glycosyltransferase involved in cell wall biosynthesis
MNLLAEVKLHWRQALFFAFVAVTLVQLCYYWGFFRRLAFYQPRPKEQSQQHPITVIVCARDQADNLIEKLPGVLVQTYPTTHEVIVVNDNSVDETKYLLDELKKTFRHLQAVNLEYEAKLIPGKKYPLSIGIKEARHEVILLTDADCVPASEFWMQKMQDGYDKGIEVVLGYGAYNKKPGVLNKLIRFETFHSALQYLSYALAGTPYMGVGRNLSYTKKLFFQNKGFSALGRVPGGDDDLFINMVATKENTNVVIDPEAFTLSEPKKNWREWMRQKSRHYATGKFYKGKHRFLLGLYSISHFLFYPLFVAALLVYDWRMVLAFFLLRFLSQALIYYKGMDRLQEKDLWRWWWLLDIWMFLYYLIFAPALWKKPRQTWN